MFAKQSFSILRNIFLFIIVAVVASCSPKSIEFIGISEIKSNKISLQETDLSFKLVINNPNWYGLRLNDNQFNLELEGLNAQLQSEENWRIKPGKNYLPCRINYNTLNNIKAAKQWMLNGFKIKGMSLKIDGKCTAKKFVFRKDYLIEETLTIFE